MADITYRGMHINEGHVITREGKFAEQFAAIQEAADRAAKRTEGIEDGPLVKAWKEWSAAGQPSVVSVAEQFAAPSEADIAAANRILRTNHPRMAGLEGVDLCQHALDGGGQPAKYNSPKEYVGTPYRHHVYRPSGAESALTVGLAYCLCGNPKDVPSGSRLHIECWKDELK